MGRPVLKDRGSSTDTDEVVVPLWLRSFVDRLELRHVLLGGLVLVIASITACTQILAAVGQDTAGAEASAAEGERCDDRPLLSDTAEDGVPLVCLQSEGGWTWQRRDPRESDRPVVVYYSDSLGFESISVTRFALDDDIDLVFRGFPGTAPCDWVDEVDDDMETYRPDLVVAEFVGNARTACMSRTSGEEEIVERYREDARRMEASVGRDGVRLIWMTGPRALTESASDRQDAIEAVLAEGALASLVDLVDTGAVLEDATGEGVSEVPCGPWEGPEEGCEDGTIPVRSDDGIHLCVDGDGTFCDRYSAGQFRFGVAVADAIREGL